MTVAPLREPYDPRAALFQFAPMLILTRELEQALVAQFIANGNQPLTEAQVLAITGTPPPILTSIPRLKEQP